jgi:hypothetical protein
MFVYKHNFPLNSRGASSDGCARSPPERAPDAFEGTFDVADDERCLKTNDAVASELERRIPARVTAGALAVIRAIDLNHETLSGSQEIRDEAAEQRHLTAKDYA